LLRPFFQHRALSSLKGQPMSFFLGQGIRARSAFRSDSNPAAVGAYLTTASCAKGYAIGIDPGCLSGRGNGSLERGTLIVAGLHDNRTAIIGGITAFFVLVRCTGRTRVDHVAALNCFLLTLSDIGAYSISIIRRKDRSGRTRVSNGRAEACQPKQQRQRPKQE